METSKKNVLITGFGPFGNHLVNASWKAVKKLEKLSETANFTKNYKIVPVEITVCYEDVRTLIPKLWKKYEPAYVIHVGVSSQAKCLNIERKARNIGYCREDVNCTIPEAIENVDQQILETMINIEKICQVVNTNCESSGCTATCSDDAGHYLCEYTFFQSLSIDPKKVLFIHVPDFNVYPTKQSAQGIHDILQYLLCSNEEIF